MRPMTCLVLFATLTLPAFAQEDESQPPQLARSPAARVAALTQKYNDATKSWMERYQAAPKEERAKLMTDYPQPDAFAPEFLALADEFGKLDSAEAKDAAARCLIWIVRTVRSPQQRQGAASRLVREHIENPELAGACQSFTRNNASPVNERFLREVLTKSPHEEVQGRAAYALAQTLLGLADRAQLLQGNLDEKAREGWKNVLGEEDFAKLTELPAASFTKDAETLLERVATDFGDLSHYRGSLAEAAKSDLFELRSLSVGMVAPDIEGEDVDGVPFKLSDYRGKVVMLDFWGDW